MNKKPDLAKLFGASSSETFLGLPLCKDLNKINASSAFIGAPCATPYKAVGAYAKNGPYSIRNAAASLNANIVAKVRINVFNNFITASYFMG